MAAAVSSLNGLAPYPFDAWVVGILPWRELHQPESLAHTPARDHATSQAGGLLDIAFGPGRLRAIDDLLGRAASSMPTILARR